MKKTLLLIFIALILGLTVFVMVNGLSLGGFTILGIKGIQEKNDKLDTVVAEATKLATVEYPRKINELESSVKELEQTKQEYDEMANVSTSDEISSAAQILNYHIETLWTKIGIHAKQEGVKINIAVVNGTGAKDNYNLNFTVTGSYVNISEFVRDLEDDSTIGFKIDDFTLKPSGSEEELQATFTCRNIIIKGITETTTTTTDTEEDDYTDEESTEKTNTTNSTKTNNTTNKNTTNSTNKTNTSR